MTPPEFKLATETEYQRTKTLYTDVLPQYIGTLALSQDNAQEMPIDLNEVYGVAIETLTADSQKTESYARTFGALKICLALDESDTSFDLLRRNEYLRRLHAEIQTTPGALMSEMLFAKELDAPYTYILSESDEPQSVEMSLIQALHMLDLAVVTDQFDARIPNVQVLGALELLELRRLIPEAYLRTYGNVRGLRNVPSLLGTVVSTDALEKAGIETASLSPTRNVRSEPERVKPASREKAAFIGITTAKRPHIGHALLLVKAIADSPTGQVVVELNDQGPRVEQAIRSLAQGRAISDELAATLITSGEVSVTELERAYRARGNEAVDISVPYALTANNAYYRTVLREVVPEDIDLDIIANSELLSATAKTTPLPGELELFGGAMGMTLLGDGNGNSFVIEAKGKLTLRGVFARLAGKYALTLVDSPAILSRQELQVLAANGLEVQQGTGINALVDFQNMSGTNGDTILLESLRTATSDSSSVFVALRKLLDDSICFDTRDGGICPNFASKQALRSAYEKALNASAVEVQDEFLRRPIAFENVKREYLSEVMRPVYGGQRAQGKATAEEIRALAELFPVLKDRFSARALSFVDKSNTGVVPKNLLSQADQQLIQNLRNANSSVVISMLVNELVRDPKQVPSQLKATQLYEALTNMGYALDNFASALRAIDAAKGIYKVK